MDIKTAIFIIGSVAVLVIVLLVIKNRRDRKKLFPTGSDPVEEQHTIQHDHRDKI